MAEAGESPASDAAQLRVYLLERYAGDWGLSDEDLASYAALARAQIMGARWSWKEVATRMIIMAAEGPSGRASHGPR